MRTPHSQVRLVRFNSASFTEKVAIGEERRGRARDHTRVISFGRELKRRNPNSRHGMVRLSILCDPELTKRFVQKFLLILVGEGLIVSLISVTYHAKVDPGGDRSATIADHRRVL